MVMKQSHESVEVTVSNRTIVRLIIIIAISFFLLKFVGKISHILELIFLSFFLALALNPAVHWISHRLKIKNRTAASGVAYIGVVIVLMLFLAYIVPPFVSQSFNFVRNLPQTLSSLNDSTSTLGHLVQRYHLQTQLNGLVDSIRHRTINLQTPVIAAAGEVGTALISIITVFVLTFMMLIEGPRWLEWYWSLEAVKKRENDKKLAAQMYRIITGYVNGQVLLSFIGAIFGLIALLIASSILHVSVNAVALAGILLITGLIPMIGHIIGAVAVVIACLFVSAPLAIIIAIFLIVYLQIENATLQPYIQSKYNELTPMTVFIAALIGIGFGGLLGAFIAIPAVGCAKILLQDYMNRKRTPVKNES